MFVTKRYLNKRLSEVIATLNCALASSESKRYWTAAEDARLLDLVDSGMTMTEIGSEIGRSSDSVRHRCKRLRSRGLIAAKRRTARRANSFKRWTPRDEDELRRLRAGGMSNKAIAAEMRRTVSSIATKAYSLGITKRHNLAK